MIRKNSRKLTFHLSQTRTWNLLTLVTAKEVYDDDAAIITSNTATALGIIAIDEPWLHPTTHQARKKCINRRKVPTNIHTNTFFLM
jgi:hypothetical protein